VPEEEDASRHRFQGGDASVLTVEGPAADAPTDATGRPKH
jgi:hypothetical protein